jgi:hypothetical protein
MHGCQKVEDRLKVDPILEVALQNLVKKIREHNVQ